MSKENTSGKPMTPAQIAAQGVRVPPPPPPPPPRQAVPPPPPPKAPPPAPNPMAELRRLLQRPVVKGLYYNGKQVTLDGYQFIECRFDNCVLIVNGTNFEIHRCVIDKSTTIEFGTEAGKIIRLYNTAKDGFLGQNPFDPLRYDDGSVTIHGELYE
jgi:hypothetical protein